MIVFVLFRCCSTHLYCQLTHTRRHICQRHTAATQSTTTTYITVTTQQQKIMRFQWWHYSSALICAIFPVGKSFLVQKLRFPSAQLIGIASCNDCNDSPSTSREALVALETPITLFELRDENLVRIVNLECSDLECNQMCWKCLGYEFDPDSKEFMLSGKVFPKWALKYPIPPDIIGMTRQYGNPEVDKPVRDASMDLMRSIPRDFKGGVKSLESVGFKLYKINELTPNKTRRAQLVNWLLYYRERLFGKSFEQLKAERENEREKPEEVNSLPSEQMFQLKRLDAI